MIHSCSPAALAAEAEGGGRSRRRRSPTRSCILLSFSYLFPIPTASHLSPHHFPRSARSKSPKRWTAQGQGSHFTATGYVHLPWAIHHNRNLSGFPHKSTKKDSVCFPLKLEYIHFSKRQYKHVSVTKAAGQNENGPNYILAS